MKDSTKIAVLTAKVELLEEKLDEKDKTIRNHVKTIIDIDLEKSKLAKEVQELKNELEYTKKTLSLAGKIITRLEKKNEIDPDCMLSIK